MNKVKFWGIGDDLWGDKRRFTYENDDYTAKLRVGFVDEDAPIDLDYYPQLIVERKNEEVPGYILTDVQDVRLFDGTILGNPTVGFTLFGSPRYFSIDKNSSDGLRRGKQFLTELDAILREQFPGYGILYHEEDYHYTKAEKKEAWDKYFAKLEIYDKHERKYPLSDLLNQSLIIIPADEVKNLDIGN